MITLNLLLVALLIVATAFFVATEFAIVKIRPSRVDQMVQEGKRGAAAVHKIISDLDGYLSACQLGITITALGLGWLGEPTFQKLMSPLLAHFAIPDNAVVVLSFLSAFLIITFLHVVLGELAPKTVAIQKAEQVTLLFAPLIIFFYKLMYPLIWALNGTANRFIRLFGLKPAKEFEEAHSEEELRIILSDSYESGHINKTEYGYLNRIFAFDELLAREIMVPRTDMVCLSVDNSFEENMKIIRKERYTRFPIMQGNKDNIVGMINTKEFFLRYRDEKDRDFNAIIHPILSVPESIPVSTLLRKMQQNRAHIAILVDEYGGTAGMITIEDILEEIVGDIKDEFDNEEKEIEMPEENRLIVDGKVLLTRIEELLDVNIDSEDHDTIGGWLFGLNPELKKGSVWEYGNMTFRVLERERHRIRKVEIVKHPEEETEPASAD